MEQKIEKMVRMRRNVLLGALIGAGIGFAWFMLPSFKFHRVDAAVKGSLFIWLLTLIVFGVRYWLYKKKLRLDSSLRVAVNDERVKLNWLKAYRFSFYVVILISFSWKAYDMGISFYMLKYWPFPDLPWLILFGGLISLVGSFLFFNRETQNE